MGCPCGPQHISCSTNTDIECLLVWSAIKDQWWLILQMEDLQCGCFFYKLWTSPLLTSGQGERNSQVSQAYWANQGLLLFRTSIYGSFTSIVDSGSKQLAKASFKQMQDCFEYFENGHGKRLPPTCIMCGCPVEIRSLHVYLDSSMKLLLFKIYGVEPWEFAFRRCSDSVTCSTPKLFKIRDYPIQPNLRVQLVVGVEICPAVTKLSMDVFALSWAIKGFSSSLLGRNLQRNPTLLEYPWITSPQTWYLAQLLSCGSWTSWDAFQICVKHACTRASEGMFSLMLQRLPALFLRKYASTIAIFKLQQSWWLSVWSRPHACWQVE